MSTIVTADKKAKVVTITQKQIDLLRLVRQNTTTVTVVKQVVTAKSGRGAETTFAKNTADALVKLGLVTVETVENSRGVASTVVKPVEGVLLAV